MATSQITPQPMDFGSMTSAPFFPETIAAPPALVEYLGALEALLRGAATTPYAVTCYNGDLSSGTGGSRFAWRVNSGTMAFRLAIGRSSAGTSVGAMADAEVTESGAGFGALVPSPIPSGVNAWPPGDVALVKRGSALYDAAPAADEERMANATLALAPASLRCTVAVGISVGGSPVLCADLTAI